MRKYTSISKLFNIIPSAGQIIEGEKIIGISCYFLGNKNKMAGVPEWSIRDTQYNGYLYTGYNPNNYDRLGNKYDTILN